MNLFKDNDKWQLDTVNILNDKTNFQERSLLITTQSEKDNNSAN